MPLRIYTGDIAGMELVSGILLQLFWLIVFLGAGILLMRKALRQTVIQGG